ncbi:MAG: response regulator transcription factor [Alphaproteobacteria bacterium]
MNSSSRNGAVGRPASASGGGIEPRNRERIEIAFADPQREIRYVLRSTVVRHGYREVQEYARTPTLKAALVQRTPDLIIIDAELPEGDACQLISDIRANKICDNPFVPVIITAWQPSADMVRRMVNSGADDLLVKPISPAFLLQRIEVLAGARKPFVVTSDYIGPDRRKDVSRGDGGVPLFDVPNTLQAKARGQFVDPIELSQDVAAALLAINDQRLKRNAFQIAFAVGIILGAYREQRLGAELLEFIEQLIRVAVDTKERLAGSEYEQMDERVESLEKVAQTLRKQVKSPDSSTLKMLETVSRRILEGFNPERSGQDLTAEVLGNIKTYAERQRGAQRRTRP